jgi:hypothetical protein
MEEVKKDIVRLFWFLEILLVIGLAIEFMNSPSPSRQVMRDRNDKEQADTEFESTRPGTQGTLNGGGSKCNCLLAFPEACAVRCCW